MLRMNQLVQSKRRLLWLLPCLFSGLALATAPGAAQSQPDLTSAHAQHSAAAPKAYRVINLPGIGLTGFSGFNARDQMAFSIIDENGAWRAYFYDGKSLQDIGTLGGTQSIVTGMNDAGEVAGYSYPAGDAAYHAFKWSRQGGMRDLGTLGGSSSITGETRPINHRGQVVGYSATQAGPTHAFLWRPGAGMRDLGGLPGNPSGASFAHAINDAGMIGGLGEAPGGNTHAFVWTHKSGMIDLGTLGGTRSGVAALSDDGMAVGNSTNASGLNNIFVWTRSSGMRSIGTAGGVESFLYSKPMSRNGNVAANIRFPNGVDHAGLWTRARGLIDLGTLGGPISFSYGVNNREQVVGGADISTFVRSGFIWTRRDGMIDLNKRLRHAPPGLRVEAAAAISDNGTILAFLTGAFALLKPDCGCPGPHTVAPIESADTVEVGAPFDASVSFAGNDPAARHNVFWSWGDGSGVQQGNARESRGLGQASASHRYIAPGIYTVSVKVGDRSGQGPTVSRTIIAYEKAAGNAVGSGWFQSPATANRKDGGPAGRASFSFLVPSATSAQAKVVKAQLQFQVGMLNFRSVEMRPLAARGAGGQFEGRGTINGTGDYGFKLTATAGTSRGKGQAGRFGLRIWQTDPKTGAEVVVYDNLPAHAGSAVPAVQGEIFLP